MNRTLHKEQETRNENLDYRELRLCRGLDKNGDGEISPSEVTAVLEENGLSLKKDERLRELRDVLREFSERDALTYEEFCRMSRPNIILVERALHGELILPEVKEFGIDVEKIYEDVLLWSEAQRKLDREQGLEGTAESLFGNVADYIPPLAKVSPDKWGVAICTVDGQRLSFGDKDEKFSIQSICKPINYCLALMQQTEDTVHQYIGFEPSGQAFNTVVWDNKNRPHNPLINAGAIMCASLISHDQPAGVPIQDVTALWKRLSGGGDVSLDASVAIQERETGFQNIALANLMKSADKFPPWIRSVSDVNKVLEFYFNCCAIEISAESMAVVAATLANAGLCPIARGDDQVVLSADVVRSCLSITGSCGMYDSSGRFAFRMGIPAKSGVGGGIMIVIPGVMGICVWSPPLDRVGNSVRGEEFCRRLGAKFSFHAYDNARVVGKRDPRIRKLTSEVAHLKEIMWASSKGDLGAIEQILARQQQDRGLLLGQMKDYDRRTPLHVAAAEGRSNIVRYIIELPASRSGAIDLNCYDRWGGTPLDDALIHGDEETISMLRDAGAQEGKPDRIKPVGKVQIDAASSDLAEIIECIWAASMGHVSAVQRFIARGISPDAKDYDARTPLHLAASENQLDLVRYLVRHVKDPQAIDRWGQTPLQDAERHGHIEVAEVIREALRVQPKDSTERVLKSTH